MNFCPTFTNIYGIKATLADLRELAMLGLADPKRIEKEDIYSRHGMDDPVDVESLERIFDGNVEVGVIRYKDENKGGVITQYSYWGWDKYVEDMFARVSQSPK